MDTVRVEPRPKAVRSGDRVRCSFQDGPLNREEMRLSEQRKYRSWTAKQNLEIALAGARRGVDRQRRGRGVAARCRGSAHFRAHLVKQVAPPTAIGLAGGSVGLLLDVSMESALDAALVGAICAFVATLAVV